MGTSQGSREITALWLVQKIKDHSTASAGGDDFLRMGITICTRLATQGETLLDARWR
jgi:hypothetical protein